VVIIKELVLAGLDKFLEESHAEDVDGLGFFKSVEVAFPKAGRVGIGILHHFFDLIFEVVGHCY